MRRLAFVFLIFGALVASSARAETRVLTIYFHGTGSGLDPGVRAYPGGTADLYLADTAQGFDKAIENRECDVFWRTPVVTWVWTAGGHSRYKFSVEGVMASSGCLREGIDPDWGPRGWSVITGEALLAIRAALEANPGDKWILNLVGHSRGGVSAMTTARAASDAADIAPWIEKINILAYDPVPGCGDPMGRLGASFTLPSKVSQFVGLYAKDVRQFSFEPVVPTRESMSTTMWMLTLPGSHTDLAYALVGTSKFHKDVADVGRAIGVELLKSANWGNVDIPWYLSPLRSDGNPDDDGDDFTHLVNAIWNHDYSDIRTDAGDITLAWSGFSWLVPCNEDGMIRADTTTFWPPLNDRLAFVAPYAHDGHHAPWWCAFIWINKEKVFWLKEWVRDLVQGDWTTLQSLRGVEIEDKQPPVPNLASMPDRTSNCPVRLERATATDPPLGLTIFGTTEDPLTYSAAGTYTVHWTFADHAIPANKSTAIQKVTITPDTEPPVIEAPPNKIFWWPAPVINPDLGTANTGDECGAVTIQIHGKPWGDIYPAKSSTTLTYQATDVWGNTGYDQQIVAVTESLAPPTVFKWTAPDATSCNAIVTDDELGARTPVTVQTVTRQPAGNLFPVGETIITWTATSFGITSTARQSVWVVDGTPPTITVPAAVTATAGPDACEVEVATDALGTPEASDNCPITPPQPSGIPLGNLFPVGTTKVTWTATDAGGLAARATQDVIVDGGKLPQITAPAPLRVTAGPDACDVEIKRADLVPPGVTGCAIASITPTGMPSNDIYPLGTTRITWTATDRMGRTATATQEVIVEGGKLPQITAPAPLRVTAGPDACDVEIKRAGLVPPDATGCAIASITPTGMPSNDIYPIGTTRITWTATDRMGRSATATQEIIVEGGKLPQITAPAPLTVTAGPDACDVEIKRADLAPPDATGCGVDRTPTGMPSNDKYPIGTTTITWTATDRAGRTATATQDVIVSDKTNPTITPPANVTIDAPDGSCSAVVDPTTLGEAIASDACTVSVAHSALPKDNFFPIGVTNVIWTATDASGNTATATQTVTVLDKTPPALIVPAGIVADVGSDCTASVAWETSATDCGTVTVVSTPPSGSVFSLGITRVNVVATDDAGNTTTKSFDVTVRDKTPPAIAKASASPPLLWPPNHKYVDVTIAYATADNCAAGACTLSVTSNEPVDGTDDGDTAPDWEIVGPNLVRLRAERAGIGTGRVYTITISCADAAGNVATQQVAVTVPLASN